MRRNPSRSLPGIEPLERRFNPSASTTDATSIVTGLYQQMVNQRPDPATLAALTSQLEHGASVQSVVNRIWNSDAFRIAEVETYERTYLGTTDPTVDASTRDVRALKAGTPEAAVIGRLVASPEYATLHPSASGYVTALYEDLLDRDPTAGELNAGTSRVARSGRAAVARGLIDSVEFRASRVANLSVSVLGREAAGAGMNRLAQSGTSLRGLANAMLTSKENITNLTTAVDLTRISPQVAETQLHFASGDPSTHEVVQDPTNPEALFVSGPEHDAVVHLNEATGAATYFAMPAGSMPHGMAFDKLGRFWVTLEAADKVVQVDPNTGAILQTVTVGPGNTTTGPHGLTVGTDGLTLWFTGKEGNLIGKINPDLSVDEYPVPTPGAAPIYLANGADGNMWSTEPMGDKILRITPSGTITEFPLSTPNNTPLVIVPAPNHQPYVWFSELAGNKIGRIDMNGNIEEFAVPKVTNHQVLAGLAFDRDGNLYTQAYADPTSSTPTGPAYIIKLGSNIQEAPAGDLSRVAVTYYRVSSNAPMFHRIILGADGNMDFSMLAIDRVGKLTVGDYQPGT